MRKIVTTYIHPDMDGISLMYAYTEYLRNKEGIDLFPSDLSLSSETV